MFAIIDIETTGGLTPYSKITEIAVIIHDGLTVIDKFTTLINPETRIPYHITRLTGITNEMVEGAPKFYEVAKQLIELTRDKIFVAHNVGFDYGFIKQEYKSLGYEFEAPKLCTVQLSRKLIPNKKSYSLGKLCAELNIGIKARHRAEGDALATTELFELLLRIKNEHPQFKDFGIDQLNRKFPFTKSNALIEKLPEATGVYYFYNHKGDIIYIGKSKNMRQRALSHFRNSTSKKAINLMNSIVNVDFTITGSELVALLLESHEIKKHKPLFNHSKKRSVFNYGIEATDDISGYKNLRVIKIVNECELIASFTTFDSARDYLYQLANEHMLCQKLTGLYESQTACFNYQLKNCNGACIQQESVEEYNKRVLQAMESAGLNDRSFFMLDKGRLTTENALVQVRNGKYIGFGYIDKSESISNVETLSGYINRYPDNRDAQQIIKSFYTNKKVKKILC